MALIGKPVGFVTHFIPRSQRGSPDPATFHLQVLPARHMVTLKNLEGGWVEPGEGAWKVRAGSVTEFAVRVGLVGWSNVIYSEDDPEVVAGRKQAGDPISFKFKGQGKNREVHPDIMNLIPWDVMDELAIEIRVRNEMSGEEGNSSSSELGLLPTPGDDTSAETATSDTATKQENSGAPDAPHTPTP